MRGRTSLHLKAWLFVAWTALVLAAFIVWTPLFHTIFGSSGAPISLLFWISHGIAALYIFTCPDCGFSLFRSEGAFFRATHPWPNRKCSRCGHDHSSR